MTLEQKEQLICSGILIQLTQILQWAHKKPPIHARPVQDAVCDVFSLIVERNKYSIVTILTSYILKELVMFIEEDLPDEEVKLIHLQGIHHLIENDIQLNHQYMFNIGVVQSIAKILKSTDQQVVEIAVNIILKLINIKINNININHSQLCTVLERDGVIHAICQDILLREEVQEKFKNDVAISLGSLFIKGKISQQFKYIVIKQLKKGIICNDEDILKNSYSLLDSLSQIQENHSLILSDNFVTNLIHLLRTNKDEIIKYSLRLITTLLEFGTDATKEEVINIIPQDFLQYQRKCGNVYNQQFTNMINSWIRQKIKMLKIAEINKQIQLNNKDQITVMIEKDVFKDLYAIDELMKEENDNEGVILFTCQTHINLSDYNQQLMQEVLKDDYFADSLFRFLHSIPIDYIMPIHIECLQKIVFNNSFNIQNFNICENRIIEIWNIILNSQNKEILEMIINQIKQWTQHKLQQLKQGQPHPYRDAFITNGSVTRLVHLLQLQNISSIKIKSNSAIILGSIFKAIPIPKEFRTIVINQLKNIDAEDNTSNINNQQMNVGFRNNLINDEKLQVLTYVAESNLEEIFSNQFAQTIEQRIRSDNKEIRQNAFQFLQQIINLSNTKIKAELFAEISLDQIEVLTNSNDWEIKQQAQNLLKVMKKSLMKFNKQESVEEKQERLKEIFSKLNQTIIVNHQIEFSIAEFEKQLEQIRLLNRNDDLISEYGMKLGIFDEIRNLLQQIITELQQEIIKEDKVNENENENNTEQGKFELIEEIYEKIMIFIRDDLVWSQQMTTILMKTQIPQQIILLFQFLPLDDICLAHTITLSQIIIWTNNEEKLQLFKLGVIDSMILILGSSNDTIINCTSFIILSIIKVLKHYNLFNELSDVIITIFSLLDKNPDQGLIQNNKSQYWLKFIQLFYQIIQFAPPQAKVQLYKSGIIQQLTNINIANFSQYFQQIISDILIAGADLVVEGQQHPWFDDLETDGTIQKLINNNYNNCVCLLYKAKILPPAIGFRIVQQIIEEIIFCLQRTPYEFYLKILCFFVESKENHQIIVNDQSFIKKFNLRSFKNDSQAYIQFIKLLNVLSRNGTDEIKQQIWDYTSSSFRVQIPSLVKFHQESMKKQQVPITNLPSSLLIDFATNKEFAQNENQKNINLDPVNISSLFIEILVLLDFYNRHTTKTQQINFDQTNISPWLETRFLLLSHSLVQRLKCYKQNDSIEQENNNVMNAITLIEDLLMKCNSHSNQNLTEKLGRFITTIKERIKQGEIIQIQDLFSWKTPGQEEQFNELKQYSGNINKEIELCLEEHNEIIIGLVDYCKKEKIEQISEPSEKSIQILHDNQNLMTSTFESVHIQSQIMNNTTIFSQVFKIDSEFCFIQPNSFLDERNQSQTQQLELQSNDESISENEQIVYGLRRILMKEKERSQLEQEELEWACEASIPLLVLILNQYTDRFNQTKTIQMRQYEKNSLLILAHIVLKGIVNMKTEFEIEETQFNIFQAQFELSGLVEIIEQIVNIHKSKEVDNENKNNEIISENNDLIKINEIEAQINILHLYLKKLQNNSNLKKQLYGQICNTIDFEEQEQVVSNDDNNSVLEQIIQYMNFYINYHNQQLSISNQMILNDESKDDEAFIFSGICLSLLNSLLIGMNNTYSFISQNKKLEIFSILTQIIQLSIQKSDSYFLLQANAIKCLFILLNNNSHLSSLFNSRKIINIINSNISDAISSPNNFILIHRAISSLHLLIALEFNKHQNQQSNLDYNYGSSLTLLTQRSRTSLINSSTSEAIRQLCMEASKAMNIFFGDHIKMKLFLRCKFGQILSLWMCSAGGEEQIDDIITETMKQLQRLAYYFNDKYNKDKEDRLIDQNELYNNGLLMKKEFEEEIEEEGIEEECEANIHSSQNKFKREADSLKRELKQFYKQQQMWLNI